MSSGLNLGNPNPTVFPASFDAAVLDGGYQSRDGMWNAYVNRDAISIWGSDDVLGRPTIVERLSERMRRTFSTYDVRPDHPRAWSNAGNLIHHALRLGLVREETTADGERGWRLLDREPHWIVTGTGGFRALRQVRGLPAAEQEVIDRAEAKRRRLNATLDRKARERADDRIARQVSNVLHADPAATVPVRWAENSWVPTWLSGSRIDAASSIVREAHHAAELDRPALKVWIRALETEAVMAIGRPEARARKQAALPAHAEIPAEDDAALEALL